MDALATADLRRLELNWTAAQVGSWIYFIVLSVYAYDRAVRPPSVSPRWPACCPPAWRRRSPG
jgi:hypothetical protein